MQIPFYLVNAFTNTEYNCQGNPCAVILSESILKEDKMQEIAFYLQQPATAFLSPTRDAESYKVRWFAPDAEIGLCGHGSFAALAILFQLNNKLTRCKLITKTANEIIGNLISDTIFMKMDVIPSQANSSYPKGLAEALGCEIESYYETSNKNIVVLKDQEVLEKMKPNFSLLKKIDVFGYAITAPSNLKDIDFVSRTIVPHVQQLEDYATGSSHAALFPYWQNVYKKNKLKALQLSSRGGFFEATLEEDVVTFNSNYEIVIQGTISI